ncbi:hypothetical protein [Pantoea sp. MBLJ3]|nr:hypothetical protein [Pantoea sp. MBLJ3]
MRVTTGSGIAVNAATRFYAITLPAHSLTRLVDELAIPFSTGATSPQK